MKMGMIFKDKEHEKNYNTIISMMKLNFADTVELRQMLRKVLKLIQLQAEQIDSYDEKIESLQNQIDGYSKALENIIGVTEAHNEALKRIENQGRKIAKTQK